MSKNKITIFLGGGLGNILFQLNHAQNLIDAGYEIKFNTVLSTNKKLLKVLNWTHHAYTIEALNELNIFDLEQTQIQQKLLPLLGFLPIINIFLRYKNFKHEVHDFDDKYNAVFGYFHVGCKINMNFLRKLRSGIDNYVKLKNLRQPKNNELVIHHRGGDYLKFKMQHSNDQIINRQIQLINEFCRVTVVTNDKIDAQQTYGQAKIKKDIEIIASTHFLDDFCFLANAKNLIISNSTFSWWASEVADCEALYEPKQFFGHIDYWSPETRKKRIKL